MATLKQKLETAAKNKKINGDYNLFDHVVLNSPTAELGEEEDESQFVAHVDKDRAINNALKCVFGNCVNVLICQRHTTKNLKMKMQNLKMDPEVQRQYLADVFHRETAAVNAADPATAMALMDDAAMQVVGHMLDEVQCDAFIEYTKEHIKPSVKNIVAYKVKRSQQMVGYDPICTTNAAESLHHALKKGAMAPTVL